MRLTFDSNILIYAIDSNAGDRHGTAAALIRRAARCDCVLTLQSLGEFFHVATRKAKLSPANAGLAVQRWRAVFAVHAASETCLGAAIDLVKRHRLSFWDAMLWATTREAGCRVLLSEGLHDGQTLDGVTCVNPFAVQNQTLVDAALPPIP